MLSSMSETPGGRKKECKFDGRFEEIQEEILFLDGQQRHGFNCGEWDQMGGPSVEGRAKMTEQNWALLTHGFIWHPDVFEIASKVVNYLGLFQYHALHARYGDSESQQEPSDIFSKWPILRDAHLYVATDAPQKFNSTANVLFWDDLFTEKTGNLLSEEREKYTAERFFKLMGPVEELICTYSRLFVGSDRSSFSGHIQRMRIHADAPLKTPVVHSVQDPQIEHFQDTMELDNAGPTKVFQRKPSNQGNVFLQLQ